MTSQTSLVSYFIRSEVSHHQCQNLYIYIFKLVNIDECVNGPTYLNIPRNWISSKTRWQGNRYTQPCRSFSFFFISLLVSHFFLSPCCDYISVPFQLLLSIDFCFRFVRTIFLFHFRVFFGSVCAAFFFSRYQLVPHKIRLESNVYQTPFPPPLVGKNK